MEMPVSWFGTLSRLGRRKTKTTSIWLPCGKILDAETVPYLRTLLQRTVGSSASAISVDLSAVSQVDTAGMGFLLECVKRSTRKNKTIRLHHPTPCVERLMCQAGIAPLFERETKRMASDFVPSVSSISSIGPKTDLALSQ